MAIAVSTVDKAPQDKNGNCEIRIGAVMTSEVLIRHKSLNATVIWGLGFIADRMLQLWGENFLFFLLRYQR